MGGGSLKGVGVGGRRRDDVGGERGKKREEAAAERGEEVERDK